MVPHFLDLLLKNSSGQKVQMIEGSYSFVSLTTNSIDTGSINNIPFGDIYLRSNPGTISGEKTFSSINTNTLQAAVLNKVCIDIA